MGERAEFQVVPSPFDPPELRAIVEEFMRLCEQSRELCLRSHELDWRITAFLADQKHASQ